MYMAPVISGVLLLWADHRACARSRRGYSLARTSLMTSALVAIRAQVTSFDDIGVVELSEKVLLARFVLRNDAAHPGRVHVVLDADVLTGDIAAPGAASEAGGHRHAVRKRPGVAAHVRLPYHDAAHGRHRRQAVNVIVVEGGDPDRVSLATHFED